MRLNLNNISKSYNGNIAVNNVSLEILSGEIMALVGPSGCGKTTVLRMIAGLLYADSGQILLDGQDITRLPANKRPTVTVFQDYALFPHLNVFDNIAYGLTTRGIVKTEILTRVKRILDIMQIKDLKNRRVHEI